MRKSGGGGFGFLVLLIVGLIVFLLTAKSWQKAGAKAVEVTKPQPVPGAPADLDLSNSALTQPVANQSPNAINSRLPDMKAATDAHTKAVADAVGQTSQ